ncbi:hypothetical protein [Nitrosomonas sp. Nm166]|uniref:hypothetical protein n=1 Tax=Nitrosomonas sp. Nm166 TaxID=1881054 RepID=UPI001160BD3B|nr:hypothetical protein [Nitrosomonas sp. Nm166]
MVNELLVLLANADSEIVYILINRLEYSNRLKTADVLFARFVDLRSNIDSAMKTKFHELMVELEKLGTRRNELVHSRYNRWLNVQGREGLLRTNSVLRAKMGKREEQEEELQPEAFDTDLNCLNIAAEKLEEFRLQIIFWIYPDEV